MQRRQANDGRWYTEKEFFEWFGPLWGYQYWLSAAPADATQLGGQDAGAPQAQADAAAAAGGQDAGAPAPAAAAAMAPARQSPDEGPWRASIFLTKTLLNNELRLRRECPEFPKARTARDALNQAYSLKHFLPLRIQAFTTDDLLAALDTCSGAPQPADQEVDAVVAEQIPRVPDNDRLPDCRTDFFVYYRNGDVIRHHPGRSTKSSALPHCMPFGSPLFNLTQARRSARHSAVRISP